MWVTPQQTLATRVSSPHHSPHLWEYPALESAEWGEQRLPLPWAQWIRMGVGGIPGESSPQALGAAPPVLGAEGLVWHC